MESKMASFETKLASIDALERKLATMAFLEQKVAALERSGAQTTKRVEKVAKQCSDLSVAFPASGAHTMTWTIKGVRAHIAQKKSVCSAPFLVALPGVGVYKMLARADFGKARSPSGPGSAGECLAVYILHMKDDHHCAAMPIYLEGTEIALLSRDGYSYSSVGKVTIPKSGIIDEAGSGLGCKLCDDITERFVGENNVITLKVTLKLSPFDLSCR
jgi:hypothetical protein